MKKFETESGRNQPEALLTVVFESNAARERAAGFCQQLSSCACGTSEPVIRWYSFDDLTIASGSEDVMMASLEARLLAFAVHEEGDLPAAVKKWTEGWLLRRGRREGILVGLVFEERPSLRKVACLKEIYLRHLAHRAGMDYLSHLPTQFTKVIPDSLDSYNSRAGQMTPLLDEILHTHKYPPPPLR